MSEAGGKSSMGMEPNVAGLLCYLFGWVTGLIFLIVEKENKFVRFHAIQSIVVFGAISIVFIILSIIMSITFNPFAFGFGLWGVLSIINWLVWVLTLILWIILMVQAYQGKKFKLPWAGNFAEKQAG
ncbi:MAG: DUF4870 domain-containing protein [Chloroflexi bacterium]|nr:DUF4870 domain-containing protein [Chloroflexota bacterium]